MRSDMAKVIVERPRTGGRGARYPRRMEGVPDRVEIDERPRRERMKQRWQHMGLEKSLNENLAPLRRYLLRNVGRPWDKVFSEICERLNVNSAVQLHIWQHVKDYVCFHPLRDGRGWVSSRGGLLWEAFLVDPRDGLLRKNESSWWWRSRHYRKPPPSPDVVKLSETRVCRRIEGIWYELELAPLPMDGRVVLDMTLKRWVDKRSRDDLVRLHGAAMYAAKKRQLNSKEIRRLRDVGRAAD